MTPNRKRRHLVGSLAMAASISSPLLAFTLTPPQTAGPFYPDRAPQDDDSDLTRVAGRHDTAKGDITDLSGRVLDANGKPIRGARVEIWQCDAHGRYRHSSEKSASEIDPGFQGFGISIADTHGVYRFRTIKPVHYPGRTPHIHYRVMIPGDGHLVTQLYIDGEPRNQRDFLFSRLSPQAQKAASTVFEPDEETGLLKARFDIVMGLGNLTA